MKRLLASIMVVGLVAGCGGSSGSSPGVSSAASSAPSASPGPAASVGTGAGPIGEPLSGLEAAFSALGFTFVDLAGASGTPVGRRGTGADGTSRILLVGDPLEGLTWSIAPPFMDMGPFRALLEARSRGDVLGWVDEQVQALGASSGSHRADVEIAGDPISFVGERTPTGDMTILVMIGDFSAMGEIAPSPAPAGQTPSPSGSEEALRDAMLGYGALAEAADVELTLALAMLLDGTAPLGDRSAAAGHLASAETAFATGLAGLALPGIAAAPAVTLGERARSTVAAAMPVVEAADDTALVAALPALLTALADEATAAAEVRTALLSFGTSYGMLAASPPPVNAGAVVPAPGELTVNGHGLSLENGDGSIEVYLDNPTSAFAIGVSVDAEIYAFEGPLVETRTLRIPLIAPGTTGVGRQKILGLLPPGLTPQSVTVTTITVGEWRAAAEPQILGR